MFTTALYVAACLVHEAGHALAAQCFGLPWKLRLGWMGPYVRVQGRYRWHENAIVALTGPAASLAGAWACWHAGLPCCGSIVGAIGVGNLLPVRYSDMSNALEALKLR